MTQHINTRYNTSVTVISSIVSPTIQLCAKRRTSVAAGFRDKNLKLVYGALRSGGNMGKATDKICQKCGVAIVDRSNGQIRKFCSATCRSAAHPGRERKYREAHPEEVAEKGRKYREANREAEKDRGRRWRAANLERVQLRDAAYRAANSEKFIEYRRAYYAANKEKSSAQGRAWRSANKEKSRERVRAWREANPEKDREINSRRRARKREAFVAPVDREAIFARDNYTCQLCGKKVKMDKPYPHPLSPSLDHILPLSKGGTHEPRNVQLAHFVCNTRKYNTGVDQLRLLP